MFYNKEVKEKFIDKKTSEAIFSPNFIQNHFSRTAIYEKRINKDLCNWTTREILDFFKLKSSVSNDAIMHTCRLFKDYTDYCIVLGMSIDNQNHFDEITDEIVQAECLNKEMLNKMIVTREELLESLDNLIEPCDKFLLLAIFEGLGGKDYMEILELRTSDFEGNLVHTYYNRTFVVSDELIRYANESANMTEYSNFDGKSWKLYGEPNLIFKKRHNKDVQDKYRGRLIYQRLVKIIELAGLSQNITGKYLKNSGMIHMIKERANGKDIQKYLYSDDFKNVEYVYGKILSKKNFYNKFKDYF